MALTQVRAKFNGEWVTLAYNAATGRYEGTVIPPGTSANQPGGYYSLEVEAANDTGQTATLTGEQYSGLRLVVRETAAPTLTLVSPPAGYLTTNSPEFEFTTMDEAGGSGIDTASAQAAIDGVSAACTVTPSGEGYSITFAGTSLSEGPHVVSVSVSDRDGNGTTASAAYTVDTVPPVLTVTAPDLHRVVDRAEVTVEGYVSDGTSGVASVTAGGTAVAVDSGGRFSAVVPLAVGVNHIPVTATDNARLATTNTIWMLRLITDRTQADVDAVKALPLRWEDFTDAQKAFWAGVVRGAYNDNDMNRVGTAVEYIAQLMRDAGYDPNVKPITINHVVSIFETNADGQVVLDDEGYGIVKEVKQWSDTTWIEDDIPTAQQAQVYLQNVEEIKAPLPITGPDVPPDMDEFNFREANDIETLLVQADRLFPLMERSAIYSGEAFAGEF